MPVPPVEPVQVKNPEPGGVIAHHDEAVGVAHIHTERTIEDPAENMRRRTHALLVRTGIGVKVRHGVRIGWIHQVHHVHAVLV